MTNYIDTKDSIIKANSTILFQTEIERLNYESKSIFIPGEVFIFDPISGTNLQPSYGGGYIGAVAAGSARCPLPAIIPNSSIITSVVMYCKLDSEFDEINLYLQRYTVAGMASSADIMVTLTSDNSTLGVMQSVYESTILYDTINYQTAGYYFRLSMDYNTGPNLRFYGIQVNYSTKNILRKNESV